MQKLRIRLQVHDTARFEEAAVAFQKQRRAQAGVFTAELRIGKSQPDLPHFAWSKEGRNELDPCAQECHICEFVLGGIFGAFPKTGAFNIHSDIVVVGITLREIYSVFALSATELKNYIAFRCRTSREHLFSPMALDLVIT